MWIVAGDSDGGLRPACWSCRSTETGIYRDYKAVDCRREESAAVVNDNRQDREARSWEVAVEVDAKGSTGQSVGSKLARPSSLEREWDGGGRRGGIHCRHPMTVQ